MPASPLFPTTRREIAGVSIQELAVQFGTPTYVYNGQLVVDRLKELNSFDVVRYAMKANSNLAMIDLVRQHGGRVDTVSAGEIQRALAAGFDLGGGHLEDDGEPPQVVYTADIFDQDALDLVLQHDLHVNVGSPDMIDQLAAVRPGGDISLRINPGFGHGHSQKTNTGGEQSKHGIWHGQLGDCLERAGRHDIQISGLHMHIGSGTDLEHLGKVCEAMLAAARIVGESVHSISAGGGLPVPYSDDEQFMDLDRYYQLWNDVRQQLQGEFGHAVSLEIEPGRFLVAESGCLVTEIRAIKQMGNNLFYLVDAGFNNLARPILYGAHHPISIATPDDVARAEREVIVGGPLCESGDIFTQQEGGFVSSRVLPEAEVGEYLVLECAGAYGAVMGSNYNSKPLAAEVLLLDGQPHLVRQRQTFDDLVRGEKIPG